MFTSTHLSSIPWVVWHEAIVIYSLHYSNCGVGIKLRQYIYVYIAVLKVVLSHAVITGATRAWSPWQLCQKLAWQGGWVQRLPSVRICWMCRDCPKLSVQHYSEKTTPSRFESVARPLAHSAAMKRQADGLPCKQHCLCIQNEQWRRRDRIERAFIFTVYHLFMLSCVVAESFSFTAESCVCWVKYLPHRQRLVLR